jgi:putative sterol carrier protein
MTDPTTEFFAELARRAHEPLLEKATGTIRFDLVQGKRKSHWLVALDKGDVTVSRRNTRADSTIRTDKALFDRLVTGHANAMAAVLRGTVTIEGDPELLIFFQRLFPGPPLEGGKG